METKLKFMEGWLGTVIKMVLFIILVYFFQWLGFVGFLLFFFGFPVYRAITHRQFISSTVKSIESDIWGKPLDRRLWDKGEIKRKKVKIIWRKKCKKKK